MGLVIRFRNIFGLALMVPLLSLAGDLAPIVYTETQRYDTMAALHGGERFPSGASLQLLSAGRKRALVPGFAASADATVSFDGKHILFSGKQKASDPWQIWEVPAAGGTPRRVFADTHDAITPFYLPADRMVYSRRMPDGFQIFNVGTDGATPLQLTHEPGDHIICDVLRDGRILYQAGSKVRDLYTVYSDGSGVETYRCDHGPDRYSARELASGDILFTSSGRPARFTSARAMQLEVSAPKGEFAGSAAEIAPNELVVSYRAGAAGPFGLYRWRVGAAEIVPVFAAGANAVQPAIVRPRMVPKWFPSALGDREGANLLCLNVYTSKLRIRAGSVATVRVVALDDAGARVTLGLAPVEPDGSFFVNPPSDRAIHFELLDRVGKVIAAEQGWFWARRGEQRVCVGCHAGPERAPENAVPGVLLRSTEPVHLRLPVHTAKGGTK